MKLVRKKIFYELEDLIENYRLKGKLEVNAINDTFDFSGSVISVDNPQGYKKEFLFWTSINKINWTISRVIYDIDENDLPIALDVINTFINLIILYIQNDEIL